MTTVIVEYAHDPPLSDDAIAAFVAKMRPCLEVREIAWHHAYVSLDRKTLICVYEARDAQLVQFVHGLLGIPFANCHATTPIPLSG